MKRVPGSGATSARARGGIRITPKPETVRQCHRCGGREIIETKVGVMMKKGRPTGGAQCLICATCQRNEQRVVIL